MSTNDLFMETSRKIFFLQTIIPRKELYNAVNQGARLINGLFLENNTPASDVLAEIAQEDSLSTQSFFSCICLGYLVISNQALYLYVPTSRGLYEKVDTLNFPFFDGNDDQELVERSISIAAEYIRQSYGGDIVYFESSAERSHQNYFKPSEDSLNEMGIPFESVFYSIFRLGNVSSGQQFEQWFQRNYSGDSHRLFGHSYSISIKGISGRFQIVRYYHLEILVAKGVYRKYLVLPYGNGFNVGPLVINGRNMPEIEGAYIYANNRAQKDEFHQFMGRKYTYFYWHLKDIGLVSITSNSSIRIMAEVNTSERRVDKTIRLRPKSK